MSTNGTSNTLGQAEQLSLLAAPSVPLQFRLDERTRRNGLQHVAALRAQIAAQAAQRLASSASSRRSTGGSHRQIAA